MRNIKTKVTQPYRRDTIHSVNNKVIKPFDRNTIELQNRRDEMPQTNVRPAVGSQPGTSGMQRSGMPQTNVRPAVGSQPGTSGSQRNQVPGQGGAGNVAGTVSAHQTIQAQLPSQMTVPPLMHPLKKGQKTALGNVLGKLRVCFGWNVKDARCDIDASAFLLGEAGKVPGDEWFVFYGQTSSPDRAVTFLQDSSGKDREIIEINLSAINPVVQKIAFVLTINEAIENGLNFSMIKDAYVRILDASDNREILSFPMTDYYNNVNSMTIGELYFYQGKWKFNPVGNGVHQDLAGQCAIYGVDITG